MIRAPSSLIAMIAIALLSLASACDRAAPRQEEEEKPRAYGEPVGVQMSASAGLPAFELALAVSRDVDVAPLVPPLSGVLHGAIKACPEFVAASAGGGVTQLAFSVEGGKVRGVATTGEHPDPCLASRLNDQAVALPQGQAAPSELRVLVQVRFVAKPADPEAP
ncbi:MAG: hypothetical protein IT372_42440 [Polyangiaceae bacterium]|nr:hypothetical protein [Polyangiaceae bacterium]